MNTENTDMELLTTLRDIRENTNARKSSDLSEGRMEKREQNKEGIEIRRKSD